MEEKQVYGFGALWALSADGERLAKLMKELPDSPRMKTGLAALFEALRSFQSHFKNLLFKYQWCTRAFEKCDSLSEKEIKSIINAAGTDMRVMLAYLFRQHDALVAILTELSLDLKDPSQEFATLLIMTYDINGLQCDILIRLTAVFDEAERISISDEPHLFPKSIKEITEFLRAEQDKCASKDGIKITDIASLKENLKPAMEFKEFTGWLRNIIRRTRGWITANPHNTEPFQCFVYRLGIPKPFDICREGKEVNAVWGSHRLQITVCADNSVVCTKRINAGVPSVAVFSWDTEKNKIEEFIQEVFW